MGAKITHTTSFPCKLQNVTKTRISFFSLVIELNINRQKKERSKTIERKRESLCWRSDLTLLTYLINYSQVTANMKDGLNLAIGLSDHREGKGKRKTRRPEIEQTIAAAARANNILLPQRRRTTVRAFAFYFSFEKLLCFIVAISSRLQLKTVCRPVRRRRQKQQQQWHIFISIIYETNTKFGAIYIIARLNFLGAISKTATNGVCLEFLL